MIERASLKVVNSYSCYQVAGRSIVGIHPGLPMRDELLTLVRRLAVDFPLVESHGRRTAPCANLEIEPWSGRLDGIFGAPSRSLILITLASLGRADVSSLRRLLPQFEKATIRQTLQMFRALGILESLREGSAISYRLAGSFCAHHELTAFLKALHVLLPEHGSRACLEEILMPPHRLKMRRNFVRREATRARTLETTSHSGET